MLNNINRPSWTDYFMALAFVVSQRSLDPDTKHGTIVTHRDNTILSTGYNSPPRGCIDQNVPLTRPAKYMWFVHSESAAIVNAARHGIALKDSTFYITGHPCEICFREIINVGAKKVIYGPVNSNCVSEDTKNVISEMMIGHAIELREYTKDCGLSFMNIFINLFKYMNKKEIPTDFLNCEKRW